MIKKSHILAAIYVRKKTQTLMLKNILTNNQTYTDHSVRNKFDPIGNCSRGKLSCSATKLKGFTKGICFSQPAKISRK